MTPRTAATPQIFMLKIMAALTLLAGTCHVAHGFDLAHHQKILLTDEDPRKLVIQFVEADAQGLQTSSDYWPLVQRFTDWTDGPGWDTVLIAKAYKVGPAERSGDSATVAVTYQLVGMLSATGSSACPIGVCNVLVEAEEKRQTTKYLLKEIDGRWVIGGPQDGPIVNVRFAYNQARRNNGTCVRGHCATDPVVLKLKKLLR